MWLSRAEPEPKLEKERERRDKTHNGKTSVQEDEGKLEPKTKARPCDSLINTSFDQRHSSRTHTPRSPPPRNLLPPIAREALRRLLSHHQRNRHQAQVPTGNYNGWRPAVAVRPCTMALWDIEIENEKARESLMREKMRKKMNVFFLITIFLIFFNYKKKSQNDVVLAHLTAVDNWGLTEYRIDNNWKLKN